MPRRKHPFVNKGFYHVFSHSVANEAIFKNEREKERFIQIVNFYRFEFNFLRYSEFLRLTERSKNKYLMSLYDSQVKVKIHAFAIMDNHYHFLLEQNVESGVSNFVRLIQNSYARYFNLKHKRKGTLFLSPFQSVVLRTEDEILHVCRYIHLNPVTAYVVKGTLELQRYKWTSFSDYTSRNSRKFIDTDRFKSYFKSTRSFIGFHKDQVKYQRDLKTHSGSV